MNWLRRAPPDPKLPPGDIGVSIVGNTFAFHNDAQALILNNIERYPDLPAYRAKVIGKDVALVVDYRVAQDVTDTHGNGPSRFSKRAAYKEMMAPFFVEPNILLEDSSEPTREANRAAWDAHMVNSLEGPNWTEQVERFREIAKRYRAQWCEAGQFEVYKSCKSLARDLVFQLFLGLDSEDDYGLCNLAKKLSDTSLRGQFALPVRASLGRLFISTYSAGYQAQAELRTMVKGRIQGDKCPFAREKAPGDISPESIVTHTSMFASSLVVKAIASYLTFCLIQLSRHPEAPLESLMKETERLCPPIIGILRRLQDPWTLSDMEIPAGWDVWLYFPLINRDTKVYGTNASRFDPNRWDDPNTPPAMSFGYGSTQCLGMDLVRRIAKEALEVLRVPRIQLEGEIDSSLEDFLGWEEHPGGWAGVKQLPVQRPREEVVLRYGRGSA